VVLLLFIHTLDHSLSACIYWVVLPRDIIVKSVVESEVKLEDLTGVELYLKLCEKLSIVPLSCVKSNINKTHFHMPHRGIGARGVQALTPPISVSNSCTDISILIFLL